YNFVSRPEQTQGPFGLQASLEMLLPGDFVQLRFAADRFGHTPVVVEVGDPPRLDNILVAAHSVDADYRPLSTYNVQELRAIHILGAYPAPGTGPTPPPPASEEEPEGERPGEEEPEGETPQEPEEDRWPWPPWLFP